MTVTNEIELLVVIYWLLYQNNAKIIPNDAKTLSTLNDLSPEFVVVGVVAATDAVPVSCVPVLVVMGEVLELGSTEVYAPVLIFPFPPSKSL